jgi:hypothetical protein
MVFLNPAPEPERMEVYYSNESGDRMRSEPSKLFRVMQRLSFQRETHALRKALRDQDLILDVGAGDGALAMFFSEKGYRSLAVDFYPASEWPKTSVPYKDLNLHGGQFTVADIKSIIGETPKAVVMRHVLEHLFNPRIVIETFRNAQVEYLYIVVPNRDSCFAKALGANWYYWDPPRHLNFFNSNCLEELLGAAGYRTVAAGYYGIDEVVTSIHRKLFLSGINTGWISSVTSPKGMLAGLSSALSSPFCNTVCWSLARLTR